MASASGRRPKPLIYKAEKDWKKDGLNPPVFPLAGLMLLIRSHPVRPVERPPGAPPPTMCTPRGCACVWVYAWWSRGPPECYSITNDQRMERRHKTGPKRSPHAPHGHLMPLMPLMVTSCPSWSPRGHLMVASWSPRGRLMHLVPPHGRPECLSAVIYQRMRQRFDPYKLGDCASWLHIWRPPAPYRFFWGVRWTHMGGLGGSHTYI